MAISGLGRKMVPWKEAVLGRHFGVIQRYALSYRGFIATLYRR